MGKRKIIEGSETEGDFFNSRESGRTSRKERTAVSDSLENLSEPKKKRTEVSSESDEEDTSKRKATEADKERKREKNRLKRAHKKERKSAAKPTGEKEAEAQNNALSYLRLWRTNRDAWSFKKVQQIWLLNNLYKQEKISDKDFEILLEYLNGLQGAARKRTTDEAEKQVDSEGSSDIIQERARQVVQMLV